MSGQSAGEQHNRGSIEEGLGRGDSAFKVLCQPSVSIDPGEEALDDPAAWQDLEADLVSDFLDDLDGDRGGILDPLGGIGAVGEGEFDEGKPALEALSGAMAPSRSWTSAE